MSQSVVVKVTGEGPNLVLLHGWGLNSGVWSAVLPLLSRHFRVIQVDLPGHGANRGLLPDNYDLSSLAALVSEVLPDEAILLGWSLGGLVAQQLALRYPNRVRALCLVASSPKFSADDDWPGIDGEVLRGFSGQLRRDADKTLARFLAIQAMGSEQPRQEVRMLRQAIDDNGAPAAAALSGGLDILHQADLRGSLAELKMPTLWLFGRLDSLVPRRAIEPIMSLVPKAHLEILPRASHAPFISHPQEFSAALFTFLGVNASY